MKIVLLVGPSRSGLFLYNYLRKHVEIHTVFVEEGVSKKLLIKRRIKQLGLLKVAGQLLFQAIVQPVIKRKSEKREKELIEKFQLCSNPIGNQKIAEIPSVNASEVIDSIKKIVPDIIIINGTRILSKELLSAVNCPFINIHTGITPRYRGVHGGYWALANEDPENCGVTIHLVDAGIDTGSILEHIRIQPDKADNFFTYPILQLASALPVLVKILKEEDFSILRDRAYKGQGPSRLWYHPTIFQYAYFRIFKGVK